jgi:quercetin dioxygenase-like cupin family protein
MLALPFFRDDAMHASTSGRDVSMEAITVQDRQALPPGISMLTLADAVVNDPVPTDAVFLDVRLERVPLRYDAALTARDFDMWLGDLYTIEGAHLLYVESGKVTLVTGDDEQVLTRGEQVLVPAGVDYVLRNGGGCTSLLRLSVAISPGGRGGGGEGGGPQTSLCGAPQIVFSSRDRWPTEPPMPRPLRLFISRLTWETRYNDIIGTAAPHAHPGLVGLLVESGALEVTASETTVKSHLPPGGSITIPAGVSHSEWPFVDRTVSLMAGVVSAEQELWTPTSVTPVPATPPQG